MRGNTRSWLLALALLAGGCASATSTPADAGADLTASMCDPKTLFNDCSAQCHMLVCVVSSATCVGNTWQCDCNTVGDCGPDMRQSD